MIATPGSLYAVLQQAQLSLNGRTSMSLCVKCLHLSCLCQGGHNGIFSSPQHSLVLAPGTN